MGGLAVVQKGAKINNWTVISEGTQKKRWECRCACGAVKWVDQYDLKSGGSKSCGCLMRKFQDPKAGMRYGSIELIRQTGVKIRMPRRKTQVWLCLCDCGVEREFAWEDIKIGDCTSCGCKKGLDKITHGHTRWGLMTAEYNSWRGMMDRCTSPSHKAYKYYGGRGITVCGRWADSFEFFFEDMGVRPHKHSIDRINNDGNYEPGNCRWATYKMQAANKSKRKPK